MKLTEAERQIYIDAWMAGMMCAWALLRGKDQLYCELRDEYLVLTRAGREALGDG